MEGLVSTETMNAAMNMLTALAVAYASFQLKRIRGDVHKTRKELEDE